jgi:Tol biopolymer transport system component
MVGVAETQLTKTMSLPTWAVLLPVLLVVSFFAWQKWRAPENTEPLRAVPLTTLPGVAGYPSFSPDGNHVAFTWNGPKQDKPDIYVQQIGTGSPLRLTKDPRNDYSPAWSPDGRWIGFLRGQSEGRYELRLIPPLGGPERKLREIRPHSELWRSVSLAWCPDSNCIVVTDSAGEGKPDALFVVSLESGEKRQLTNPQHPVEGDTDAVVSPDGRWLVFRRNTAPFIGELYRLPLGRGLTVTGEPSRLTLAAQDASRPTWMPDSKEILFSAKGGLWRLAVSGASPPARLPFVGEDGVMPVVSRPQAGRPARLVYVKSTVKVAPEILAKYVGVYKGQYIRVLRTVEVTFSGGSLFIALNGGPKQPIVPQSETSFSGTGLTYRFIRDDQGITTHIIEGHVSGDYKYERQGR